MHLDLPNELRPREELAGFTRLHLGRGMVVVWLSGSIVDPCGPSVVMTKLVC